MSMRSGSKNLRIQFVGGSLTHFGGFYLIHQFLRQLQFRTYLSRHLRFRDRNNHYSLSELLIALMYPMILGLEKIEVAALLKTNGVFQHLTGLPSFPDPTTLRRFLIRAAPSLLPELRRVHNGLRAYFLNCPTTPSSFWIDCDSTVQTLYGHQQGVVKGYNPKKRGKRSYHPLLMSEAHLGDCLGGFLRPGNVHTAEGVSGLFQTVWSFLPHHHALRLRADAGFYDGDFVAKLKEKHVEFTIVAHLTTPLKSIIGGLRYHRISPIFAVAEFYYQPHRWKSKERFVVLRRRLPNEETKRQTTLFTLDRYAYSAIVTNLVMQPQNIFNFYQDRSAQERIVRTLKEDYPFGKAPTHFFAANELYAELSLFAYNLIAWFKRLCLPDDWRSFTLPTIRHRLLMIPGEYVKTANVPTLRFPRNCLYQDVFQYAERRIKKLAPLD